MDSFPRSRWFARILALAVMVAAAPAILAQRAPPPLPINTTSAAELSADQLATIKAYADYYTGVFGNTSATCEEVEAARDMVIKPLASPNVSETFRFEYSQLVVPALEDVIRQKSGESLHAAVNAVIVMAPLGTDRAMTVLTRHADSRSETRWQVRMRGAAAVTNLLEHQTLDGRKTIDAARKMREAAAREDNGLILRHQLAALAAADADHLPEQDRRTVQGMLVEAISGTIDRLAQPDAPKIEAVSTALVPLRDRFINPQWPMDRPAVGKAVGAAIGKLLALAQANWQTAKGDPRLDRLLTLLIGTCEGFLFSIDAHVRPNKTPETQMRRNWESGDKPQFDSQAKTWIDALAQPPYGG